MAITQSRILSFDIGVLNMGMASFILKDKPTIERLDWRPLITTKPVTSTVIVAATRKYLDTVITGPPDRVLIEQQYASNGINVHALEIQVAIMAILSERYPRADIRVVGASARKSSAKDKKFRAMKIGQVFAYISDENWYKYLMALADPQHTCDAMTMILDTIGYDTKPLLDR